MKVLVTGAAGFLGGNQEFSIEKARRELGYNPEYDVIRGVFEGVNWYLQTRKGKLKEEKEREIIQLKS